MPKGQVAWNKGIHMWENKPHPRGTLGKKTSEETKKKISIANLGRKVSNETREKLRIINLGRKHSKETLEKMSVAKKGKPCNFIKTKFKKGHKPFIYNGGYLRNDGYMFIHKPNHPFARDSYVMEHRLTMEKQISRYLTSEERVHHRNEIKNDNRIENLEIVSQDHHRTYTLMQNEIRKLRKELKELRK